MLESVISTNTKMWYYGINIINKLNNKNNITVSKQSSNFLFDVWDKYANSLGDSIKNIKSITIKENEFENDFNIEQCFENEIAIHILENIKNPLTVSTNNSIKDYIKDYIINWHLGHSVNMNYNITIYTSKYIYKTVGINNANNEILFITIPLI